MATETNSEIRAMSHDEIDAVAGAKGAIAVIEIKVPGVTVSTVINENVSGVVLQYSSGGIEGQRA